ncbi:MAG: GAF domain-containing protein, partial [Spirochaetales bacterium]|nr:GAF domain-containing protein [Spirochaetales bacterium]
TASLNAMLAEPERLYACLLEQLNKAVPFFSGSLQVMEDDSARIVAFRGPLDPDVVMGLRFRMDPLFPNYRVVMTRKPVTFADIRVDYPHFFTRQEEFNSGHIRSWLGVPMIASDSVIGMIALDRDVVDPFDGDDVRIVQAFADHAAVAIRNAGTLRELQDALSAGDALMREMNHRVKNSLQLVSSLIDIHAGSVKEAATSASLYELQVRIASISAIHERLYKRADMTAVDLDDYLKQLADDLVESSRRADRTVTLSTDLVALAVDASVAVPLGLMVTELVMNALKYAFAADSDGKLALSLRRDGNAGILMVEDNGRGMNAGAVDASGFGLVLVRSLATQIDGEATLESAPGRTLWTIRFPLPV